MTAAAGGGRRVSSRPEARIAHKSPLLYSLIGASQTRFCRTDTHTKVCTRQIKCTKWTHLGRLTESFREEEGKTGYYCYKIILKKKKSNNRVGAKTYPLCQKIKSKHLLSNDLAWILTVYFNTTMFYYSTIQKIKTNEKQYFTKEKKSLLVYGKTQIIKNELLISSHPCAYVSSLASKHFSRAWYQRKPRYIEYVLD